MRSWNFSFLLWKTLFKRKLNPTQNPAKICRIYLNTFPYAATFSPFPNNASPSTSTDYISKKDFEISMSTNPVFIDCILNIIDKEFVRYKLNCYPVSIIQNELRRTTYGAVPASQHTLHDSEPSDFIAF